jgi:hypothetical protein
MLIRSNITGMVPSTWPNKAELEDRLQHGHNAILEGGLMRSSHSPAFGRSRREPRLSESVRQARWLHPATSAPPGDSPPLNGSRVTSEEGA